MSPRFIKSLFADLRPTEETLSSEAKTQVQFYRLLTLLAAVLIPLFGLLYEQADPAATDPMWARISVAGLFAALFATSYWFAKVRRNYVKWTWTGLYVATGWFVWLVVANGFAPDYAVGFLLLFSVLTAAVGLGARSIRPVLWFVGTGLLLTVGAVAITADPATSPLIFLASIATVATVEIAVIQGKLSTSEDLRQREEDLREERNLLNRILETSPVAIAMLSPEGEFLRASGRAKEILGFEKENVTDRTFNDPEWGITSPDGTPMPDEELPFARVMRTGEPVRDVEHAIEWPDGTRRLLSVSGAPLHGGDSKIEGAVFHMDDITDRREAKRALRESEKRFRGVFENAAHGIAVVSDEGRLLEANPSLQDLTGYDEGELQGLHFETLTHLNDLEADQHLFGELVKGNRDQYELEKRYVRKDGEVFWGRLTVSRLEEAPQGTVIGMVEDISEQKRYEEGLREARKRAEEASRLKSAMLANMSHEIRTPLTSITGFAEILKEDLQGQSGDFAHRIHKSGRRLMKTLDSVLELSKLEAGPREVEREEVDLFQVAEEAVEMLHPQAEEHNIKLELHCSEGPAKGYWNEAALNRIVENLLENAIKFTPKGGRVDLRVRQEEDAAVLEVEDTGIGMDPNKVGTLFEAFRQESEGLGREYEGSGLGLSIVKELTDRLGGEIEVETEKAVGTRFTVRLPPADTVEAV